MFGWLPSFEIDGMGYFASALFFGVLVFAFGARKETRAIAIAVFVAALILAFMFGGNHG